MGRRAFIYAAGEYKPGDIKLFKRIRLKDDDLIICADGGYDALAFTNIIPDVIIGDFDSIQSSVPSDINVINYPSEKDKTDLEICIDYAVEKGCDTVFMMGVLGGRPDHTLGAYFAMRYAVEKGLCPMILNANSRIYLVDSDIELNRENFKYISLMPCSEKVKGVSTSGLKYPLENATLMQSSSYGISNEFYNNTAKITIKEGLLFVICTAE